MIKHAGRRWNPWALAVASTILLLSLFSCAGGDNSLYQPVDFSRYQDKPIPPEVSVWLTGGPQSHITPAISGPASHISGRNRRERLYNGVDYVWKTFKYDSWYNPREFTRTADQLFTERVLGGCADYALAHVTFIRALGIPARMVMTANIDWMLGFQRNNLQLSEGHVFIEAWLEDKWHLVDTTYRYIFSGYDPDLKSYPRREYFCFRAADYWDLGITDVASLDRKLRAKALVFKPEDYTDPGYPRMIIYELPAP